MVAARGKVEYGVVREIHDERVHDREARRVEPGHVKFVMANWNGNIIFRRELRTDQRTLYRNALDHRVTVRLLERVASVPAESVVCTGRCLAGHAGFSMPSSRNLLAACIPVVLVA